MNVPVLYRASAGYLARHPWQLGLALLGIGIGVAVMVAVDLANASSRKAFLLSMDTLNGRATHQVVGGPGGVREQVYVDLRTAGFRAVAPVIEGRITAGGQSFSVLGVDIFAEAGFRSWASGGGAVDLPVLSRLLTTPGAVLVSRDTAAMLGLGDDPSAIRSADRDQGHATVRAQGRDVTLEVAGYLGDAEGGQLQNLLVTDIATAQEWFDMHGRLTRIDVRSDNGADADRLRRLLPPGYELLDADSRTQTTADMTSAFMTNLTAMSLLAMLVGVFLIYNSVGFAVLQRRPLIGTLRALGLTRAQAFRVIMLESLLLGLAGVLLGIAAGLWLGENLLVLVSRSINDLYFRVAVTDVTLAAGTLWKGALAGLAATLIAAALPAAEAAGIKPSLAMRRSTAETAAGRAIPVLAVAGAGLAGLALLVLAVSGQHLGAGLLALFMLILGIAFCVPICVRVVAPVIATVAGRLAGLPARMAVDGIRASLSRTGVAIVALAVAVSATIGVSIMVGSFRAAVSDWLDSTLRADLYVAVPAGSLRAEVVRDVVTVAGIEEHSTSRRAWIEAPGGRTRIIALSMASRSYAGTRLVDADPDEAWAAFEEEGAVVVSEPYAYRHGVGRGDSLTLNTGSGPHEFPIAATYRSYDANQGAVLMARSEYERHWDDDAIDSLGLYLAAGADPSAVTRRVLDVTRGRQDLAISSNRALKGVSMDIFDRTFIITDVLYWLAVGVALTGILGAMLALQLERSRELAVLRALGMTPLELGGMVAFQSGVIGLLSGMAAIPLGLVMAEFLIDVINRRSFGWRMDMTVDPGVLGTALTLSVVSALAAGLYPAFRSATSRPATAMREE